MELKEFKEAFEELRQGKKIRRVSWEPSIYIMLTENILLAEQKEIKAFRQECVSFPYDLSIMLSDGWLIDDKGDEKFLFLDVIQSLKQGKRVKLETWPDDCFLEATRNGQEVFMRRTCEYDFTPTFECLSASDWEILDG